MSLLRNPKNKNPAPKPSYLTIEKARVSFVPNQDRVQITGTLDGKPIKHIIPAGSSLEREIRNELHYAESRWEEETNAPMPRLPHLSFLNYGTKTGLTLNEAQNSTGIYVREPETITAFFENIKNLIPTDGSLQIPLGLSQNIYNSSDVENCFYNPFPADGIDEDAKKKPTNIFITGSPGRGKTMMASNILRGIKCLDPSIEIIAYTPKAYEPEYDEPVIEDLLGFLSKLRTVIRSPKGGKKFFVLIEELDSLIQYPQDSSWMEKRANKAIRAELLEATVFLSQHSSNFAFAFTSQSPTAQHQGIIDTCGTIVDFGNMHAENKVLSGLVSDMNRQPSGASYVKQGESFKMLQAYVPLNIS